MEGKISLGKRTKEMMLGKYYDGIEIHREEKIIYVKFLSPHRVISTDRVIGGLSDELEYIYNHQSCEPSGHYHGHELAISNPAEYKRMICERYGLPPEKCASLGTAANMNNVAISHEKFCELEVVAACTGGVETNAGRVGDTASYYEKDGKFEHVSAVAESSDSKEGHGTINTMVFISQELIPGAMVRAVMTATEAKTAVPGLLIVDCRLMIVSFNRQSTIINHQSRGWRNSFDHCRQTYKAWGIDRENGSRCN